MIPRARGPASFLRGALRSPGKICGRSSCAAVVPTSDRANGKMTIAARTRDQFRQCKILTNLGRLVGPVPVNSELGGAICMKVNDKAPDFTLQDENGSEVVLKGLRGKTVILFFYPRANTPG